MPDSWRCDGRSAADATTPCRPAVIRDVADWHAVAVQEGGDRFGPLQLLQTHAAQFAANPSVQFAQEVWHSQGGSTSPSQSGTY